MRAARGLPVHPRDMLAEYGSLSSWGQAGRAPRSSGPHIGAGCGHAVAAWTNSERTGGQVSTHVRASVLTPGGAFGAAEDVASATSNTETPIWTGSHYTASAVAVSGGGSADVRIDALELLGQAGEVGEAGLVVARVAGAWTAPQCLGGAALLVYGSRHDSDLAAGPGAMCSTSKEHDRRARRR